MLKNQKPLWIKTVKLLSTDLAGDFCDELECEDVYIREITGPIRQVMSKNMDPGDYDLWNTGLEASVPSGLLDIIEEETDEDTACELEDYYLKMEKRLMLVPVFEYWHTVFTEARENGTPVEIEAADEKTVEELTRLSDNYLSYLEEFYETLRKAEPVSEWDRLLNSMGAIYMDDSEDAVQIDTVRQLTAEFSFANISYDFWTGLTELLGDDTDQLKAWAGSVLGEETHPAIPIITDDEDEYDGYDG